MNVFLRMLEFPIHTERERKWINGHQGRGFANRYGGSFGGDGNILKLMVARGAQQ